MGLKHVARNTNDQKVRYMNVENYGFYGNSIKYSIEKN